MPLTCHGWTFSICLTKFVWRKTRSGQVTRMHSLYAATGRWSPERWNNEILIKRRKLGESRVCSRAGWEQVPVQQLLWYYWKVQYGAGKMQNCCEPMALGVSVKQLQYWCLRVLPGFPRTGLCFLLQVLLHVLPLVSVSDFSHLGPPSPIFTDVTWK